MPLRSLSLSSAHIFKSRVLDTKCNRLNYLHCEHPHWNRRNFSSSLPPLYSGFKAKYSLLSTNIYTAPILSYHAPRMLSTPVHSPAKRVINKVTLDFDPFCSSDLSRIGVKHDQVHRSRLHRTHRTIKRINRIPARPCSPISLYPG